MAGPSDESSPLLFYFITREPELAAHAEQAGVDRIMVDLEVLGKAERQRNRDTLISAHQLTDVDAVRAVLSRAELMTRVNPLHDGTAREVDEAIARGTDSLMLPMFTTPDDLKRFVDIVRGRARITGLLETRAAMDDVARVAQVPGIDDYHVGLQDLHMQLGYRFLFECVGRGDIDRMAAAFRAQGVPFGFGGIGRIGFGDLPAELIAAEHIRLGSRAVILGRVFHNQASTVHDLVASGLDLAAEVRKVVVAARAAQSRTPEEVERDRLRVRQIVARVADRLREAS